MLFYITMQHHGCSQFDLTWMDDEFQRNLEIESRYSFYDEFTKKNCKTEINGFERGWWESTTYCNLWKTMYT